MSSIVQKIKKTVSDTVKLPFYTGNSTQLNEVLDNADFSNGGVVYLYQISDSEFKDGIESMIAAIAFVDLTEFDFDTLENDEIQERLKNTAFEFIIETNKSNVLQITDVRMQRIYNAYDVNLTGVVIRTTITEKEGLCDAF